MNSLDQKVVVVTGAGSGIGRELAWQLADAGAIVAINDWNATALEETAARIKQQGGQVLAKVYDVSDREATGQFLQAILEQYGRVDGLINNAGITLFSQSAVESSVDDYTRLFTVNFLSVVHHCQLFLPALLDQPGAFLVNVSSVFGLIGYPYQAPYVASKFAVRGLTETMRQELSRQDILISCVHPGGVLTNLIKNIDHANEDQKQRFMRAFAKTAQTSPGQAAQIILRGIQRRQNRIIVGKDARFMDLVARLLPSRYHRWLGNSIDPNRLTKTKAPEPQPQKTAS